MPQEELNETINEDVVEASQEQAPIRGLAADRVMYDEVQEPEAKKPVKKATRKKATKKKVAPKKEVPAIDAKMTFTPEEAAKVADKIEETMEQLEDNSTKEEVFIDAATDEVIPASAIEERRKSIMAGLIEPEAVEGEEEVQREPNNRDSTKASNVAPGGEHERTGITVSGPGGRRRQKLNKAKTVDPNENERRGVHKIFDDRPFNNVGYGTIANDIPKKRKK